jgi:cytochrome c556
VPFDAVGGGAVRRSTHEVAGMTRKRNVFDIAKFKTSSQRPARMHAGKNKGQ